MKHTECNLPRCKNSEWHHVPGDGGFGPECEPFKLSAYECEWRRPVMYGTRAASNCAACGGSGYLAAGACQVMIGIHTELYPGIFVFDMLSRAQCDNFLLKISEQPKSKRGPNSMNKYGLILDGSLLKEAGKFQRKFVRPIVAEHMPDVTKLAREPYAFVVDYGMKTQRKLDSHFDSSAVTLNVCLGGEFTGGNLVMYHGQRRYQIKHKIGQAIVHRGRYIHRAEPLKSGWRSNLILWCSERQ